MRAGRGGRLAAGEALVRINCRQCGRLFSAPEHSALVEGVMVTVAATSRCRSCKDMSDVREAHDLIERAKRWKPNLDEPNRGFGKTT